MVAINPKLLNALPDLTLFSTIIGALLLGAILPNPMLFSPPLNLILGALLIVSGIGISAAVLVFIIRQGGSSDVIKMSESLITDRYFSISRNPLYLAELGMVIGVAVLTGSLAAFIGPFIYFLVLHFVVIPYEEDGLKKMFGQNYARYARTTRRWL